MPSPGAAILSGTHVDAAGDDAFVDGRGVNSSTQSGRSAESAHQEAEVGAEVSFSLSAVVVPRFHWAEGDDGHPPSHPAIVLKRPRAKIRWHLTREGLGNTVESYVVATLVEARDWRVWRDDEVKIPWRRRSKILLLVLRSQLRSSYCTPYLQYMYEVLVGFASVASLPALLDDSFDSQTPFASALHSSQPSHGMAVAPHQ